MSLRKFPKIENLADDFEDGGEFVPDGRELEAWEARLAFRLAAKPAGVVIDILSSIGKNPFTGEGTDASDVSNALKGQTGEVTVNINSPGGSAFQGLAIFSLLANHPGKVTVNVLGAAASAASIIAMAGDDIRISIAGSIMIHNAQAGVQGDRHDVEDLAAALSNLDETIRNIYHARTGLADGELDRMMTPTVGTWLFGKEAVDKGFADGLMGEAEVVEDKTTRGKAQDRTRAARAELNATLTAKGYTRSARRALLRDAFPDKLTMPAENEKTPAFAELAASIRGAVPAFKFDDTPRAVDDPAKPRAGLSDAFDALSTAITPR